MFCHPTHGIVIPVTSVTTVSTLTTVATVTTAHVTAVCIVFVFIIPAYQDRADHVLCLCLGFSGLS